VPCKPDTGESSAESSVRVLSGASVEREISLDRTSDGEIRGEAEGEHGADDTPVSESEWHRSKVLIEWRVQDSEVKYD
jgi:hypothetical protein